MVYVKEKKIMLVPAQTDSSVKFVETGLITWQFNNSASASADVATASGIDKSKIYHVDIWNLVGLTNPLVVYDRTTGYCSLYLAAVTTQNSKAQARVFYNP